MIHIRSNKTLPARSIICDVASRDGEADFSVRESSSPFPGLRSYIAQLGKGNLVSLVLAIKNYKYDFDVEKAKPLRTPYEKRADTKSVNLYETNLEFIHESWIEAYIGFVKYHIENNKDGVERIAREKAKDQPTAEDDDGDEVAISDLAEDAACTTDSLRLRREIPYYIKRLSIFGDKHGIHMMSFIIAVEKVKYARSKGLLGSVSKNGGKPKQGEILNQGVFISNGAGGYVLNSNNEPVKWVKNDTVFRDYIYPFVKGTVCEADKQYYEDYQHLLLDCQELGISLKDEDPLEYNTDFISDMTVTYVMDNKEYLNKLYKFNYIDTVIDNFSLDDYGIQKAKVEKVNNIYKLVTKVVARFNSISNSYFEALKNSATSALVEDLLVRYGMIYRNTNTDITEYTYNQGFLADQYGKIKLFNAIALLNISVSATKKSSYFIVHKSGILVLVTDDSNIQFLTSDLYREYFSDFFAETRREGIPLDQVSLCVKAVTRNLKGKEYKKFRRGYGYWPIAAKN